MSRGVLALALVFVVGASAPGAQARTYTARQQRRLTPLVRVVQDSLDAVVNISATHVTQGGARGFGGMFDLFERRPQKTNSVGSGAVIHPRGYVLTNAHVVERASELNVIFRGGEELPAVVVAAIPERDVAVLKVRLPRGHAPLAAITLGRSDDLMQGEQVIAIGNPVGLQHTVTTGIISALDCELRPSRDVTFKGIIQTDAAINPGNSGGPLLNILGEQIGVTTAIRADAQNVGFAIPIDEVRRLLPQMLRVESLARVRLGLSWSLDDHDDGGVVIERVEPRSPAARAGLRAGMVVRSIGGAPTPGLVDALVELIEQPVDRPFRLEVLEGGRPRAVSLRIEALPKPDGQKLAKRKLGLDVRPLTAAERRRLRLRDEGILVIDGVDRRGPARRSGIQRGDLLLRVGPYGIDTLEALGELIEDVKPGETVPLAIVRVERGRVLRGTVEVRAR